MYCSGSEQAATVCGPCWQHVLQEKQVQELREKEYKEWYFAARYLEIPGFHLPED